MNFISQSIRCNYFEWEDVELDDYYKNYIITRWETERVLTRENEQLTLVVKELEVEVQNQKKIVENLEKVEKKQNKELRFDFFHFATPKLLISVCVSSFWIC